MSEIFSMIFIALSVIGLIGLIKKLILRILKYNEGELIILIPISGHCENIEYRLRCAYEQAYWSAASCEIICLDEGMDSETRELCQRVCARFNISLSENFCRQSAP